MGRSVVCPRADTQNMRKYPTPTCVASTADSCCDHARCCCQQTAMTILARTKRSTPRNWQKSRRREPSWRGLEGVFNVPSFMIRSKRWQTTSIPKRGQSNLANLTPCVHFTRRIYASHDGCTQIVVGWARLFLAFELGVLVGFAATCCDDLGA